MIESSLVPDLLQGLCDDPATTRTLASYAKILEDSRLPPGLVLWAWEVLGVVQLAPGEKPLAMAFLLGLLLAEARGHTVLGFDAPELAELARVRRETPAGDRPGTAPAGTVARLVDHFRHWLGNGTLGALVAVAPDPGDRPGPEPLLSAPVVVSDAGLQFSRTRWMERECARLLRSRLEAATPDPVEPDPLAGYPGPLDDDQRSMVRGALDRRVCWISGGPGTGKTTCIHGLLWAIGRRRPDLDASRIALAAPTGKAAFRVTEGLRRLAGDGPFDAAVRAGRLEARTLHRLLEYRPDQDRFGRHEGNPLEADWVIVDESSMVDLALCHALLRALPEHAGLVWIGDRDQLPAVGRGAVFQACWEEGPGRHPGNFFHLTRNYRARLGLAGDVRSLMAGARLDWVEPAAAFPAGDRLVPHRVENERDWQALVDALHAGTYDDAFWGEALEPFEWDPARVTCPAGSHPRHEAISGVWARANGAPVLCVTHGGPRGTIAVNEHFRRRHPWAAQGWLPGEPVMVQANDYQRDLWNGDTGVVLSTRWRGVETTCAAFRQGELLRIFPIDGLQVARAYAFSVHKSQGSEYAQVTLALPEAPSPVFTRELVYTAVTRGRSCVRVAGTPETLAAGLGAGVRRRMNLGSWLFGA